jgi:hypothetical protein
VVGLAVASAAGAPPLHHVLSPGARAIGHQVGDQNGINAVRQAIAPTTSLTQARCDAWRQRETTPCPDDSTLEKTYWPAVRQAPHTIYVGVLNTCDVVPLDDRFDVEYAGRSLTLRCYSVEAWVRPRAGAAMGTRGLIASALVIVPAIGIPPGRLAIYREDRAERWFFDDVRTQFLGAVTLT